MSKLAAALAAALLATLVRAEPASARNEAPGVVYDFAPWSLYPDAPRQDGPEGRRIVLTYRFLADGEGRSDYRACPRRDLWRRGAEGPSCERARSLIVFGAQMWAEASGRLVLRPVAPGAPADVRFGFGEIGSVGVLLRNSDTEDEDRAEFSAHAASNPRFPGKSLRRSIVLLSSRACWYDEDPSVCPPRVKGAASEPRPAAPAEEPAPSQKLPGPDGDGAIQLGGVPPPGFENHSILRVAVHEFGHAMGFGHHAGGGTVMSIGGTGFDRPQPLDIRLAREMWRAAAESDHGRRKGGR